MNSFPLPAPFYPEQELSCFGVTNGMFTEEQLASISELKHSLEFERGTTSNIEELKQKYGSEEDIPEDLKESALGYRICEMAGIPINEETVWLYNQLAYSAARVNYDLFMHDISHLESIQYLKYEGNGESQYKPHVDYKSHRYESYGRKISGILMLSDPSEYEGGQLCVDNTRTGNMTEVPLQKGDVVFFDSQMLHMVAPVTSGNREVLVFWVIGKCKF
jgi:hypothetical protein